MFFSERIMLKQIDIDLSCGVYTFDSLGATGKTYLKKLLKYESDYNTDILAVSVEERDIEVKLEEVVNGITNPRLIMIDRYGVNAAVLKHYVTAIDVTDKVILLDAKDSCDVPRGVLRCQIELTPQGINIFR